MNSYKGGKGNSTNKFGRWDNFIESHNSQINKCSSKSSKVTKKDGFHSNTSSSSSKKTDDQLNGISNVKSLITQEKESSGILVDQPEKESKKITSTAVVRVNSSDTKNWISRREEM